MVLGCNLHSATCTWYLYIKMHAPTTCYCSLFTSCTLPPSPQNMLHLTLDSAGTDQCWVLKNTILHSSFKLQFTAATDGQIVVHCNKKLKLFKDLIRIPRPNTPSGLHTVYCTLHITHNAHHTACCILYIPTITLHTPCSAHYYIH